MSKSTNRLVFTMNVFMKFVRSFFSQNLYSSPALKVSTSTTIKNVIKGCLDRQNVVHVNTVNNYPVAFKPNSFNWYNVRSPLFGWLLSAGAGLATLFTIKSSTLSCECKGQDITDSDVYCACTKDKDKMKASKVSSEGNSQLTLVHSEEDLTYSAQLKQACCVTVDSITRILSQMVVAAEDYDGRYRDLVGLMMQLLQESRTAPSDELDCKIIVVRNKMAEMNKIILQLDTFAANVERLGLAAAETAFLAGAEYSSQAMVERVNSALNTINKMRNHTKNRHKEMLELEALVIVESGKDLK